MSVEADLNTIAYHDAVLWGSEDSFVRARFHQDTGIDLAPPKSPIERSIDALTGARDGSLERFVEWFNREIWGEDMVPEKMP